MYIIKIVLYIVLCSPYFTMSFKPYMDETCPRFGPYTNQAAHVKRLIYELLEMDYDQRSKPVKSSSKPVVINVTLQLYQIVPVVESHQMVVSAGISLSWYDEYVYWDPKDYAGVDFLVIPYTDVWVPEFILQNAIHIHLEEFERITTVRIQMDPEGPFDKSTFLMSFPTLFQFTCLDDIKYFPFDKQECALNMVAWAYSKNGMVWNPSGKIIRDAYIPHGGWDLIKANISAKEFILHQEFHGNYSLLNVAVTLRRRPLYYIVNMIVPTIFVSVVAIVGLFSPSRDGTIRQEKITIGLNTAMAMAFYAICVAAEMPASSRVVPLIGIYFLATLLLICVGCIVSVFVLVIQRRGLYGYVLPPMLKRMSKYLGSSLGLDEVYYEHNYTARCYRDLKSIKKDQARLLYLNENDPLKATIQQICYQITIIERSVAKENDKWACKMEWAYFADVIDRLLLAVFLFANFAIAFSLFISGFAQAYTI